MQFSKTRKKKIDSSNRSYQSMNRVIKCNNRLINSIRIFFIFLKMFIMQQRKNDFKCFRNLTNKIPGEN